MSSRVTAQDVAKAAGVSPATVSLVFHNRPGVKAETRARVLALAEKLGYKQPAPAALPAQTRTLLLITYKQQGSTISEMPFFEHLTRGITDQTRALGNHRLVVSYFYAEQDAQQQIDDLRALGCDGAILLATEMHARDVDAFEALGIPVILLDSCFGSKPLDSVVIDNYRGAKTAVRYLHGLGHTRIGYLHCTADLKNFRERRSGYLAAMRKLQDKGADVEQVAIEGGPAIEGCYQAMCSFLDEHPAPSDGLPTAFFADNDHAAALCIRALQEHGLNVPEDVSVIGFDDVEFAASLNPPLTTMAVPQESMGELAVKRLADLIDNNTRASVRICVQPELVIRSSARPPRAE